MKCHTAVLTPQTKSAGLSVVERAPLVGDGTRTLRKTTIDRLREEMRDFEKNGNLLELVVLQEAMVLARSERSVYDNGSCTIAESILWCMTGTGLPDD